MGFVVVVGVIVVVLVEGSGVPVLVGMMLIGVLMGAGGGASTVGDSN